MDVLNDKLLDMNRLTLCVFSFLVMVSCQKVQLQHENVADGYDLFASVEQFDATKTSMDQYNNVLWSADDQLVAFMKTTLGIKYQIKEQYVGMNAGSFSKVPGSGADDDLEVDQALDHNVVMYPYSSNAFCLKNDNDTPVSSYKVNIELPQTQLYAENSFGNGAFPMIAVSPDNQLSFMNICGGLKLQFKGTGKIKEIKLEGLGDESISGKATVFGYTDGRVPSVSMSDNAAKSVTLDCGDGVQLDETTVMSFIIAVPPVDFASGMKITVTDTDGFSKTLTNKSPNTIKRSSLLTFPVITFNKEASYWTGKKMVWNGDSISYGSWLSSPTTEAYPYLVGKALGMDVYNFAIGGSYAAKPKGSFETFYWDFDKWTQDVEAGLVDTSKKYLVKDYNTAAKPCRIYYYDGKTWKANSETGGWAIVERMKEMVALHPDADVIGIAAGTNDFYTSACSFGSIEPIDYEELKAKYEYDESVNLMTKGELHKGMKLIPGEYTLVEASEYTVCVNIPVVAGCEYRVKNGYRSWFLDADKNPLSTFNLKDQNFRFIAPDNARYVSITFPVNMSGAYVYGVVPDVEELSKSTFCGAIHTICQYLKENYEGKDIVFVTPIERYQGWCTYPEAKNSLGYTLKDYADAIIEICSYYSIPVIDFYRTAPVDPHVDKSLFGDTDGKYVHPNKEGHEILASVAISYFRNWK